MHLVNIMTAHVCKHIGIFTRAPVLEVRMSVVIRLVHLSVADAKFAEFAFPVKPTGRQRTVVKPLMILHADYQPSLVGAFFNLHGLSVFHHQWFHRAYMLVIVQCRIYNLIVELVRHGNYHNAVGAHFANYFLKHIGKLSIRVGIEIGMRGKALSAKRLFQHTVVAKFFQRCTVQRTDADISHNAQTLKMVNGRQNLNLRYHSAADDTNLRFTTHCKAFPNHR